jgi:hypothetical protein
MKYKVDYFTSTGTMSDNIFIGIFDTPKDANTAKTEFIKEYMGESKEEYCRENQCDEQEYYEELESYENSIVIEPIQ